MPKRLKLTIDTLRILLVTRKVKINKQQPKIIQNQFYSKHDKHKLFNTEAKKRKYFKKKTSIFLSFLKMNKRKIKY